MCGMFRVAMPEIILDQTKVITFIGKIETAGMPQGMWMDVFKFCPFRGRGDNIVYSLSGQGRSPFVDKEPGQVVLTETEVTPECPQLIPGDGMFDRKPAFQPAYPDP